MDSDVYRALGFFRDGNRTCGHIEGKGVINPPEMDTTAILFRWCQNVIEEVKWFNPTTLLPAAEKCTTPAIQKCTTPWLVNNVYY